MDRNVDGGGGRRGSVEEEGRWRCGDLAAAAGKLHVGNQWARQGKAAGTAAARDGAAAVAAAVAAVGSPPCPSLSSHLR